ncbi:MAG TPA: BamA/TamA family outer membrane protein [Blastocatellia bacterium]|nr:BamA/TamA family outer membrane protein [Blastocatellia bacterium]
MDRQTIVSVLALIATVAGTGFAQNQTSPLVPPALRISHPPASQAKQFRLGNLEITGNTHTKLFVILSMIPLSPGEIFNQSLWDLGLDQINRSGLFELLQQGDVVMKPDEARAIVDVELHLKERDHQRVDLNGGGGTTGGTSLGLDYSNINLTGRGDRLAGRARIGTRERSGGASYSGMLYGRLPLVFELSGLFQRIEFVNASTADRGREPLFVQRTAGASIGAFLPLNRSRYTLAATTRAGLVYSFTSTNLADALLSSAAPRTLEQGGLRVASLTPLLVHDTLDRAFDPQHGEQLVLGVEITARALASSLNTLKPYLDYRRFFPLARRESSRERQAIGFRVRASHIRAFGEPFVEQALSTVRGVPIYRRVFLGGETEVRGYDVNSIAPLALVERFGITQGNPPTLISSEVRPVGGDTQLVFNAEYRVPLIWQLSAAAFFDIGGSVNARGLTEETFERVTALQPLGTPVTIRTVLRPPGDPADKLPLYRASLGGELRFPVPLLNIPLRLIFAWNPNAQRTLPEGVLLAPEKRFAFRIGFSRTL